MSNENIDHEQWCEEIRRNAQKPSDKTIAALTERYCKNIKDKKRLMKAYSLYIEGYTKENVGSVIHDKGRVISKYTPARDTIAELLDLAGFAEPEETLSDIDYAINLLSTSKQDYSKPYGKKIKAILTRMGFSKYKQKNILYDFKIHHRLDQKAFNSRR